MQAVSDIFSLFTDAIWLFNVTKSEYIYVNKQYSDIFETPLELIKRIPKFYRHLVHPEDIAFTDAEAEKALAGEQVEFEYRILINGKVKWLLEKRSAKPDDQNTGLVITGIVYDITKRKEAEIKLTGSEKAYRQAFLHYPSPAWIYDAETLDFLAVNNAALTKYGYTEADFLSMTIEDLLPAEDICRIKEDPTQTKEEVSESRKHLNYVKKSGERLSVRISQNEIMYQGRKAILATTDDDSGLLKCNEKLALARRNLETLINHIDDMIWSFDSNYRILSANKNFRNSLKKFSKRDISEGDYFLFPEHSSKPKQYWQNQYRKALQGQSITFIDLFKQEDGRRVTCEVSIKPIINEEKVIGVVCLAKNIEERLEEESRRQEQSKELLELISLASHEIRGPVAGLLGLTDIFNAADLSDPFNAEVIGHIKTIAEQLDSIIHLIVNKSYRLKESEPNYSSLQNQSVSE